MANDNDVDFFNLQIERYVRSMETDGLLDAKFSAARALKENDDSYFFAELIPLFCKEMKAAIQELTQIMGQDKVDYDKLFDLCIKLKGTTSCFGTSRLLNAINDLKVTAKNKSKEGCDLGLQRVKDEYHNLDEKLQIVHQLEKRTLPRRGV